MLYGSYYTMHPTTILPIMSKSLVIWTLVPSSLKKNIHYCNLSLCYFYAFKLAAWDLRKRRQRGLSLCCGARRQIRYQEDEDEDEEYGHNEEIAKLELYSESARGEALLVHALVDEEEVDVLIFKGFSSCLSYSTSPDPTRSILPARAVIKSIDRIKGPFDPSNIEYLQKGVTWEEFKTNLLSN